MTFQQFAYRNVLRNRRSYAAFFLASVFSVMVFFVYSMFIFHPAFEKEGLQLLAIRGMFVAEVVLYVFMLFFLFYSMSAFLQARSKEFGILIQIGMAKRQLNRLVFLETMLIGAISTFAGTAFGFAFTKFFFMIGRELMELEELPLYVSWKPFVLTALAFASLFAIISFVSVLFIRTRRITELLAGYWSSAETGHYSKGLAVSGLLLLGISYGLAAAVTDETVYKMVLIIPPLATLGTYLFFTHTVHWLLVFFKKNKRTYWHRTRLISIAESSVKLKESAQMFFIVSIVSTVAFLTVGTLASFTSYTGDYRSLNPLGLLYVSFGGNEREEAHIDMLMQELEEERLTYDLVPLEVKRQTSERTGLGVELLSASDFNQLAIALGYEEVQPERGKGIFVPDSADAIRSLEGESIRTVLAESGLPVTVEEVYPHLLFPMQTLSPNSLVLNDADFQAVDKPLAGLTANQSTFTYYAFHVPEWTETSAIGTQLEERMARAMESGTYGELNFYFENPGNEYRRFKSSFTLLLFIGLLVAAVFLLAAGSFIYFKLYTGLERDKKQYSLLVRLGMTEKELVKIVNRQLIPQFFLPWGLALLHSAFAFISLQTVWDEFAELSILGDMAIVLACFTVLQIIYFYLIRWRYLTHLQAS